MLLEHKCGRGKPDRASRGFFSCFSGWHHAPSLGSLAASKRRHPPPLEPDSWRFCHLRYTNTHNEHTLLQTRGPPETFHFPQGGKRIFLVRLTFCAANDVAAPNQKSKEGGESDSGGGKEGGEREASARGRFMRRRPPSWRRRWPSGCPERRNGRYGGTSGRPVRARSPVFRRSAVGEFTD